MAVVGILSPDSVSTYTQTIDKCWDEVYSAPNGATVMCSVLNGLRLSFINSEEFSSRTCQSGLVYRGATSYSTQGNTSVGDWILYWWTVGQTHHILRHSSWESEEHVTSPPPYNGKKKQSCVYCKGDHFLSVCEVVTDVQKRLEIIKKGNLCYNCLGNHSHTGNSKFHCKICKHKHVHHTSQSLMLPSKLIRVI